MPGQRATACRPPGRGERGLLGRPRPCARSRPWLALLAPLLAFAPPALAGPEDLPPWQPEAAKGPTAPAGLDAQPSTAPAPTAATPSSSTAPPPAAPAAPNAAPPNPAPPAAPSSAPPATPRAPASPADPDLPDLPPVPIDPNDAPFLHAPNNQVQTAPPRTRPDLRRGWSSRRRLAFTLAPAFASLRREFQGPRPRRNHGAGVDIELDVQIWRWIWLRAQGTYSGHPVDEVRVEQPDKSFLVTAPAGTIHVAGFGGGPVFALDLGRFLPLIEVGLGGLRVATPAGGTIAGLRGESCRSDGSCDVGLRCTAARTCEPTIMPELYFGGAVDLLVRRHFSFGAQFRYYARLTNPGQFPLYLLGTLRISVRF